MSKFGVLHSTEKKKIELQNLLKRKPVFAKSRRSALQFLSFKRYKSFCLISRDVVWKNYRRNTCREIKHCYITKNKTHTLDNSSFPAFVCHNKCKVKKAID